MRRRAKPAKAKSEPKLSRARRSPKNAGSRVRDLEKRLAEAVDQQTATSEILQVISSSPTDVEPVFDAIVKSAAKLCGASTGGILRFAGEMITIAGAYNASPEGFSPEGLEAAGRFYPRPAGRDTAIGRAILQRRAVQIPDVALDAEYGFPPANALKYRTILAVPMLRSGVPIGGITMWRREVRPFSEKQVALLTTFANQAVIAIENARLFRNLTEALEQQTATSEILGVISRSQTDVQPVFETVAANALRLCEATFSAVNRFDGELIHLAALHKVTPEGVAAMREAFPMPPGRGGSAARAILTRGVVHIPDVHEDPEYALGGLAQTADYRSLLSVPMLRDGHPIGAIVVAKIEVGPSKTRRSPCFRPSPTRRSLPSRTSACSLSSRRATAS